jgi:hypothetical protein
VYTDANIVMGAESADFFFDCWHLKVIIQLWGTTSNSNIEISERFQSEVLRLIINIIHTLCLCCTVALPGGSETQHKVEGRLCFGGNHCLQFQGRGHV